MQRKVATTAIGPSALRGQGRGVLAASQQYLASLSLARIPKSDQKRFADWLDRHTDALLLVLPVHGYPWGAARKAINLFLRDALYNRYLCQKYTLRKIECWLEIPLDSAVAHGLRKEAGRAVLPRWLGLKHLRPNHSDIFQAYASEYAGKLGVERVHLDMYLWLENR